MLPNYSTIVSHEEASFAPSDMLAASDRRRRKRGWGKRNAGEAGWLSSVINLVNTILGAGILAMPLVMSHMGIVLGSVVIVWAGLTSGFGLYLQSRCSRYLERGTSSFFALSQITYPNASVIFDAAIAVKCFGVSISYLIIIGDLMPGVVEAFAPTHDLAYLEDRQFWITFFMLPILPFCFLRRLDSLKYTSVAALVSIGYLIILVLAHYLKGDTITDRGPVRVLGWAGFLPALSSLPVVVFAYTCHQNMFPILNELKINSPARTTSVVAASIGSACSAYLLVGLTGYLSFGNNVTGNIVGMYPPSAASTISKIAIVLLLMFSYPLQLHPCRASIDAILNWRPHRSLRDHLPSSSRGAGSAPLLPSALPHSSSGIAAVNGSADAVGAVGGASGKRGGAGAAMMGKTRFAVLTSAIVLLTYFVAMSVSSLERVLAYVGSTGSTSISFILPGLFYYKISDPDSLLHQQLLKAEQDRLGDHDHDDDDDELDANHEGGHGHGHGQHGANADDSRDMSGSFHSAGRAGTAAVDEAGLLGSAAAARTASYSRPLTLLRLFSGLSSSSAAAASSASLLPWRRKLLRRLSLALALYGVFVMVVCLVTHTFFVVLH